MRAGVINFLGSNCLFETIDSLNSAGFDTNIINQNENNLDGYDLIVLPGGFSYGDYVASGRIAKFTPVISALREKIKKKNSFTLGICNGFQILCESGLLPGALLENTNARFICDDSEIIFNNEKFTLPIAHHQGRYYIDDIKKLDGFEIIRYSKNPNGSLFDIAGIFDKKNNIMGLMPHPERNFITPYKKNNGKIIFNFIREKLNGII